MASQQKIVITVKPTRRSVNIQVRGKGEVLKVPLAGYGFDITNSPLPPTTSTKAYLTSLLNTVITNLE